MRHRPVLRALRNCLAVLLVWLGSHGAALAQIKTASITGLSDAAFGTASFTTDLVNNQSICVFIGSTTHAYNVRATGSGSGSAFSLAAGTKTLAYDVQWSGTTGQSTGTALTAGVAKSGFTSNAFASGCGSGPATSASLIVILRAAQASVATAGSYSGTLSVTITPE